LCTRTVPPNIFMTFCIVKTFWLRTWITSMMLTVLSLVARCDVQEYHGGD
jgi:hypothetical protein